MAVISIPSPSSSPQSRSRKRKRIPAATATAASSSSRWRTDRARRIYTATLLSSLRRLRLSSSSSSSARAVRAAADRSLAASARGASLWSRSILSSSSSGVSRGKKVRPRARAARPRRPARTDRPARPGAVEGRARSLGRVVPGCRKLALPSLLDETADYIAALEMQVRAMTIIADILSAAAPSSSSSPS